MGVDYDAVAGIGISLTDDIVEAMINAGYFTREDYDDDIDCISNSGIEYQQAGSYYSGETYCYIFVDGGNLIDINKNSEIFIKKLAEIGIVKTKEDLKLIADILVC